MILRVGAFCYRVRFVQGYIEHEGAKCLGLCDNDKHEILVSDVPGLAQQVQVICHEYMEAWLFHFGQGVRDKEDYCDLFGMAMAEFVFDLTHHLHRFAGLSGRLNDEELPVPSIFQQWENESEAAGQQPSANSPASAPINSPVELVEPVEERAPSSEPVVTEAPVEMPAPRESVARKLATRAAQVGLHVNRVYDPPMGRRGLG